MSLKEQKNETLLVNVANKDKCPCVKCKWGKLFGGWDNWFCVKYVEGKPNDILYKNKECPYFEKSKRL